MFDNIIDIVGPIRTVFDTIVDTSSSEEFHVDFLKSKFNDLSRSNMFKIHINPPSRISTDWQDKLYVVLAKNCSFPSTEVGSYDLEWVGKILHIPTNKMSYGELRITFYSDDALKLRINFHSWQNSAYTYLKQNFTESGIGSVHLQALGELTINQYDSLHTAVYGVKATKCWPKVIGEIELSQSSVNTAEEFTVTFAYTDLIILK